MLLVFSSRELDLRYPFLYVTVIIPSHKLNTICLYIGIHYVSIRSSVSTLVGI